MSVVLIQNRLTKEQFEKAKKDYFTYIKITIDINKKLVAVGGEYHADAEKVILENDGDQQNVWGGGVNLETGEFETNAVINIKPGVNPSLDILNPEVREAFLSIVKESLKEYV